MGIAEFGEIRFSAIGTEFSDPYSLTDSTKTIRLSHYYKNIQDIPTNHINTFTNSFDEFRLILFRGKKKIYWTKGWWWRTPPTDDPWDDILKADLNSFGNKIGSGGRTYYEILSGVKAENLTKVTAANWGLGFDNLGTHSYSAYPEDSFTTLNNQHFYPDLVLQGAVGDSI